MYGISRIALIAAFAATPALAADDEDGSVLLDGITVTASSETVAIGHTGATVNVVVGDDMKKAGDQTVADVLARLPGVSMTRSGGLGTSTTLRLRGLSGTYIGVRIDGIDVVDPSGTQSSYDFGATTSGGISRVEVLRGSQSALFGSEAIGGVVDITSFRASKEGTEAEISVEAGPNATYSGSAAVALKAERTELAFSASRTVTDGISAYAFGTENDGFRSTNLSFFASHALTDTVTVGLNGFARDSYAEFDSQTADNLQTENGKLRGLRAFVSAETGAVSHELSFSTTKTERGYPLGYVTLFSGNREQLAYKGKWDASGQISLNWGADNTTETFAAGADKGSATTNSIFAEMLYAPSESLDLSLALRHDDHSSFGGHNSARAALAWRPSADWIIRAVASTGFRAPSLYELNSGYGDTSLRPEESKSFELGAEYLLPGGSIQATLYDTRIDNMIGWDDTSMACPEAILWASPGCYNQVSGTTRTRGVELTGSLEVATGWTVFGNYTYADAATTDAGTTDRLVRVPRHDLSLGVDAALGNGWGGSFTVQHVADVTDTSTVYGNPPSSLPDYTVANMTVTYDFNDSAQAYLRVENLFDADYETVRNYGQPGRSVFVGLRASF